MWLMALCTMIVGLAAGFVGAAWGMIAGIDWHQRRRIMEIRRTRANIEAAIDRDPL